MKKCEEEEKEVLNPLVKMLKYQEYCEMTLKKDDELWVVIPSRVDRIDRDGEL